MIYNRKMSKTMKQKACEMRKDGYTMQEIADEMGVNQRTISLYVPKEERCQARNRVDNYIYPNINKWLIDNRMSMIKFAREVGITKSTMSNYLAGLSEPRKSIIDKILEITGMSYEECFREE